MSKLLILSHGKSDLSEMIMKYASAELCEFEDFESIDFDAYDAFAFLGGNCDEAVCFPPSMRARFEELRETGKPIFAEFIRSIGYYCSGHVLSIDHQRLVYGEENFVISGLKKGDILDAHYNDCCKYDFVPRDVHSSLTYYDYINAHDYIDLETSNLSQEMRGLWLAEKNTLISAFRLCNFHRARFAPQERWKCVIKSILDFLGCHTEDLIFPNPICTFLNDAKVSDPTDTNNAIQAGLAWFKNADMLIDDGKNGVYEGFSHHISAKNGVQKRETVIRTDCTGETGGAFMMDWLLHGNECSKRLFENLEDCCFDHMQEKTGAHKGMLHWTNNSWGICYQDDVARAILPTLLCQNHVKGGSRHFADALDALRYLLRTTGPNGLRVPSTSASFMTEELEKLHRETNYRFTTKAHHNSFYQATLLLAYMAGGPKEFYEPAVKGLTTIMELYPDNERETSETEELCRLIFPLAVLYRATGEEKHKAWLYRVAHDLERFMHESGGYCEWDTDYKAACSRRENGECALLANNGDPVVDLLYSNNWLPLGFAYAYMVTKDNYFREKWLGIAAFMLRAQVHSEDKSIDGSWSRGFDVKRREIYGVPHDIGWSPCCVETGWTMGEILMGLQFMQMIEQHKIDY